jgi:hypothetical protein
MHVYYTSLIEILIRNLFFGKISPSNIIKFKRQRQESKNGNRRPRWRPRRILTSVSANSRAGLGLRGNCDTTSLRLPVEDFDPDEKDFSDFGLNGVSSFRVEMPDPKIISKSHRQINKEMYTSYDPTTDTILTRVEKDL